MAELPKVAIIGAGLAGITLARGILGRADVRLFEKSRGLGGRMSTRRAENFQFDHGAQYFTARGPEFKSALAPFLNSGTVQRWEPRLTSLPDGASPVWNAPRYVAVPGMNGLAKAMADGLKVHRATRVALMQRTGDAWHLQSETGEDCGTFDWVVSTAPAEQTVKLMPEEFVGHPHLRAARMQGCYSLMIGLAETIDLGWDAAVATEGPLAWLAMNQSKPWRSAAFSLLCQSSNDWAQAHIEDDQKAVEHELVQAAASLTGLDLGTREYTSLHRWRFAKVATPAGQPYLMDVGNKLAAAGDWCGAGRVEAAFESGTSLAMTLGQKL